MNKYLRQLMWLGLGLFALNAHTNVQACPSGIPVANNLGCIPPNDPLSPYYQGSGAVQQAAPQLPLQPTGYWVKTWGAIAPSPKGGVLGTAVGADSKAEAERLALADCKKKGGQSCEVELAYHNQCSVMVTGKTNYRLASAGSIPEASQLGIQTCKKWGDTNCRVYYSACTEPRFVKY
ncbi:DUF4189 domain-containing protein [Acinetobacter courvalinii]|nr:DUF4189 domain-containing protein [Acinetobacter courvalinii]GGH28829.1 hypothetical protein GCM10007354_07870 [Acinetobacter courvalinii]